MQRNLLPQSPHSPAFAGRPGSGLSRDSLSGFGYANMAISPAMLVIFGSKSSKHNDHLVKPVWPSCWSPRKWWFHLKSVASEWRRQDSSVKVNQIRWFQNPLPMRNSMCLGCRVDMNMSIHLTYMSHITSALHMWQSLQSKKNALAFTGRCSTKAFNHSWEIESHGMPWKSRIPVPERPER